MIEIKVLHIGIKNWPLESEVESGKMRGGGSTKYCDLLLNGYSNQVASYIITRILKGQSRYEYFGNIKIFRVNAIGGRKLRLITLNILSFFLAISLIKKEKINLLHGHILTGITTAFILGKMFNIPVVGTPYSVITYEFSNLLVRFTRFFEKRIYRSIDRLIFESNENKRKSQHFTNEEFKNSLVIHTGINIPKLERKYVLPKNQMIKILYLGRLVNIKCIENLILSLNYLDAYLNNQVVLDIVGEGEMHSFLQEIVVREELDKKVFFHGYVHNIIPFYENADIFILPSKMEGLSISLMEAMSYGLACIVNNFGVPFDAETVFAMENNEPRTIAKAIEYFLLNPSFIEKFGKNARDVIKKEFSVETFSKNYLDVYKNLLKIKNN